ADVLVQRAHYGCRCDYDKSSRHIPDGHEYEGRSQGKYDLLVGRIGVLGQSIAVTRSHTRRVLPSPIKPVLSALDGRAGLSAHRCAAVVTELAAVWKRVSTVVAVHRLAVPQHYLATILQFN